MARYLDAFTAASKRLNSTPTAGSPSILARVAASVQTSGSTIYRTKKRFVEISLEDALSEERRPAGARKLSGKEEAQLVALACSGPQKGCARWTLKLLASGLVELVEHPSISRETIRCRWDYNDLNPWQKKMWCIAHIDGE